MPLPSAAGTPTGAAWPVPAYVYEPHAAAPDPNCRPLAVDFPIVVIAGEDSTTCGQSAAVLPQFVPGIRPAPPVAAPVPGGGATPGARGTGPPLARRWGSPGPRADAAP